MFKIVKKILEMYTKDLTEFWWPVIPIIVIIMAISCIIQYKKFSNSKNAFYKDKIDNKTIAYFEKQKTKWRFPSPENIRKYNTICFILCCVYLDLHDFTKFYEHINSIKLTYPEHNEQREEINVLLFTYFSGEKSISVINTYNEYKKVENEQQVIFKKMSNTFPFSEFDEKYAALKEVLNANIQENHLCNFIELVKDISDDQ